MRCKTETKADSRFKFLSGIHRDLTELVVSDCCSAFDKHVCSGNRLTVQEV